jgi:hypothetical protein
MSLAVRLEKVERRIQTWNDEEEPCIITIHYKDAISNEVFQAPWHAELHRGQYRVVHKPYYDVSVVPILRLGD